ncbi:MAG: glycosyltransferase family 4 protein [Verrucomicrobiota bacterium]
MLGHFLHELVKSDCAVSVAMVEGSKIQRIIPQGVNRLPVPNNQKFSLKTLHRQVKELLTAHQKEPFDLVHGWAARDWELTVWAGTKGRVSTMGTLHDHPEARFFSLQRRLLMRGCVRWGLNRLVCVSHAVRSACIAAGYPAHKLVVVHNGVPTDDEPCSESESKGVVRLGFLAAFSERKGLRGLFETVKELERLCPGAWELFVAGRAQDAEGQTLVDSIRWNYANENWWARVHWCGWAAEPRRFLDGIDILICPSSEFEPFGLVLCEAGLAAIPVVAASVGGIPEIVVDGETGWLFEAGQWKQAASLLARLVRSPELGKTAGIHGAARVSREFSIGKMVAGYKKIYSNLLSDV